MKIRDASLLLSMTPVRFSDYDTASTGGKDEGGLNDLNCLNGSNVILAGC
jgi:hypothetical protein